MSLEKQSDSNPLISIVMPTHNRSDFLMEAVNSVLKQTYTNWELFIIADACTDNTSDVIKPYLKDKRIHFYNSEKNLGGAGARNYGMNLIGGNYVAFLDDDDVWLPKKLEVQLNFLIEHTETALVYCNFSQWFSSGKKKEIAMRNSVTYDDLLVLNLIGSFSFVMLKMSKLNESRIDSELKSAQDWDLWLKVLKDSKEIGRNCNENLVDYRIQGQKKISVNRESVSKGYEKWFKNHKEDMNPALINYHKAIVEIKRQDKVSKCLGIWFSFFLRNPSKLYFNLLISKQIYSRV